MTTYTPKIDSTNHIIKTYFKNNWASISMFSGLCVILGIGFYLRWETLDVVRVVDFFTRDVERAFNIAEGNYLPLAGPELNNGGRLPGPFMYILLALPLLIDPSYESIFIFNFILNFASILFLYPILKRHFGIEFSILTAIFFSLSLHHIQAVMFPMNPSFIFPFAVLYMGALLKFNEKKDPKYLLWILLTILLGIQFHFSIATYAVLPIFLIILFQKKIPGKTVLAGLIIAGICFLPFIIHKTRDFVPDQAGVSIKRKLDTSFVGVIKIALVQNTISRLAHSQAFEKGNASKAMLDLFHIGFSIIFYSLIFIVAQKIRKQGIKNCTNELIILLSFYFPALIYEVFNPWKLHFWYQYIFILPEALVLSFFILSIYRFVRSFLKVSLIFLVVIFISYLQILSFKYTKEEILFLDKQLFVHVNASGSYKNSKILLKSLMSLLDLSPQEFFDRIYFLDFYPSGYRRLAFATSQKDFSQKSDPTQLKKPCYFIMFNDNNKVNSITKQSRAARYKIFLKDKTIKINKSTKVSLINLGFPSTLQVFEYVPNQVQSCYNNAFNPFVVTKSIRNLLIEAKSLAERFNYSRPFGVGSKTISENEKFDSNNELQSFYGEYVVQNGFTKAPFRLKVILKNIDGKYFLRGEVESYYFFGSPSFNIQSMSLLINPAESNHEVVSDYKMRQVAARNDKTKFDILSRGTLATADYYNIMSNNGLWNYPRDWFREIDLPQDLKLKKNKFFIDLTWKVSWRDGQFCCYSSLPHSNIINLKSPKK
jgi:hypothetical protein